MRPQHNVTLIRLCPFPVLNYKLFHLRFFLTRNDSSSRAVFWPQLNYNIRLLMLYTCMMQPS